MDWWILAAVAASVVTTMLVGMLWYGPLFGKAWIKAIGWEGLSDEELKVKQADAMPGYLTSMAMTAVASVLLWAVLVGWGRIDAHDTPTALGLGALYGLAGWGTFYLPGTLTGRFFEDQTWGVWLLGAGYWGVLAALWGLYTGLFASL